MHAVAERRRAVLLAAVVLFAYGYFFHFYETVPNPNETSRLYLTMAVVDEGTLAINGPMARHGVVWDRAEREGRLYCDKAPGLSFLAVPAYAAAKGLLSLFGYELTYEGAHLVTRLGAVLLPSVVFCYFLYLFLGAILPDPRLRLVLVLVYALGSLARTYGVLFFGHQTAAVLSTSGLMLLWRHGPRPGGKAFVGTVLGGLCVGAAFSVEYPTFVTAVVAGGLALWVVRPAWRLPFVALAVATPVALCLWYNHTAFGNPFSPGYAHLTSSFAAVHAQGLFGVTTPKLEALYGSFVSPERGLFVYMPWLLAALPGFYFLIRERGTRTLGVATLALFVAYVYFISSFSYWVGGDSAGPRHLTPLVPVMLFAVAAAMHRLQRSAWESPRLLLTGAFVFSLLLVHAVSSTFSYFEPKFENPYREVTLELWREGVFPASLGTLLGLQGLWAALPAALPALGTALWACLAWPTGLRRRGALGRAAALLYPLSLALLLLLALLSYAPKARDAWAAHETYRYLRELHPPRLAQTQEGSAARALTEGNYATLKSEPAAALERYKQALRLP